MRNIAAFALLTAAACSSSPTDPSALPDVTLSALEQQVVILVNAQRARGAVCGPPVGPLSTEPHVIRAAHDHSVDMATNRYLSHTSLDGRTFQQRMRDAGYTGLPMAENIASGYATAEAVMAAWMSSSGHCRNIMSGSGRDIGVGFANGYWTLNVGG